MLRLSSFVAPLAPLIARIRAVLPRLPPAPATPDTAPEPPPSLPVRLRKIALESGALIGAGLATLAIAAIVTGNAERGFPVVVLNFIDKGAKLAGEGETGAHAEQLAIEPSMMPFLEPGPYGPLPKVSTDGTTPAQHYARLALPSDKSAIVSIVVGGLGLNEAATRDAIEQLPPEVTLAFSPYAPHLARFTQLARQMHHEFLIEVPIEPFDYPQSDPGPLVLLVDAPQSSNLDRLHRTMGESAGYIGLLTTARARFATSETALLPLVTEAKQRGLLILDDGRAPVSKMPRIIRQLDALGGVVDRRLDDRPSADGMALALIEFERLAVEQGRAIGALDLYPVALDRLVRWTTTLPSKGLVLQPVSAQIVPTDAPETTSSRKPNKTADEHRDAS